MPEQKGTQYTALRALERAIYDVGHAIDFDTLEKSHSELVDEAITWEDIENIAKEHEMVGMLVRPTPDEFRAIRGPIICRMQNGDYVMVGFHNDSTVMFLDMARDKALALPTNQFHEVWTGEVMPITPKMTWKEFRKQYNLEWFYQVIIHYKPIIVETMIASAFIIIMSIMTPLFVQVVIDKVVINAGLSTLTVLGFGMVALIFLESVLSWARTYLVNQITTKIDAVLSTRLFRHLISLPVPYFEHRRVGEILMRMGMMGTVRNFMTGKAVSSILDVLFSVFFVAMMFFYSVPLTLIVLVIVPLYIVQTFIAYPVYWKKYLNVGRVMMARQAFIVEAVTGMQTIKALAIEPQFLKKWEKHVSRFVQAQFDTASFSLLVNGGNAAIRTVSSLVILWYGGYMVMDGDFTLGQLIAFQILAGQATGPLINLLTMWPDVQHAFLGLTMMTDILNQRMEPVLFEPPKGLAVIRGDIEVSNVSFRYRLDLPHAVENISFSIKAGEKIGIVGRSGSGKSTLAGLLEKIYFPEEGTIKVDGTDLKDADYQWLRRQMGVVMQDSYLFDGSIRDNIAESNPTAPMEDVMRAAQIAGAHEFILELDEGYDTRVGERGASLSGGQRQRIAIARALLSNPRIMVFDEATSALDYESERTVIRNLEEIGKDRTMIIIAHRLVAVEHCDRILVLDHGHLVEQGTPQELLALGGIYARLHAQQVTD